MLGLPASFTEERDQAQVTITLNVRYHHDRDLTSPATDVEKDEVRDCVP